MGNKKAKVDDWIIWLPVVPSLEAVKENPVRYGQVTNKNGNPGSVSKFAIKFVFLGSINLLVIDSIKFDFPSIIPPVLSKEVTRRVEQWAKGIKPKGSDIKLEKEGKSMEPWKPKCDTCSIKDKCNLSFKIKKEEKPAMEPTKNIYIVTYLPHEDSYSEDAESQMVVATSEEAAKEIVLSEDNDRVIEEVELLDRVDDYRIQVVYDPLPKAEPKVEEDPNKSYVRPYGKLGCE